MRTQFHAAVSALFVAFATILIAIVGMQFVVMRATSPSAVFYNVLAVPVWFLETVLTLLALGYLTGTLAWLVAYAARRSGVHRLAAAQTWVSRR